MCDLEKYSFAGVIPDLAIHSILDYAIPLEFQDKIQVGSRVVIPIKAGTGKGTVWQLKKTSELAKVKPIQELAIEASVFTKDLIKLAEWMSYYYATPLHQVLQVILPKHIKAHEKEKTEAIVKSLLSKEALLSLKNQLSDRYLGQKNLLEALLLKGDQIPVSVLLKAAKQPDRPWIH